MFGPTKIIVGISKQSVTVARVSQKQPATLRDTNSYPYTPGSFISIFQAIKKQYGALVRIGVSDELSYVVTVAAPSLVPGREEVQPIAQEHIPEPLSQTTWDFRLFEKYVEIAAIVPSLYTEIDEAMKKTGIHVEAIEPQSVALARQFEEDPEPLMIVYQAEGVTTLVVSQQGVVLGAWVVRGEVTAQSVRQSIDFVKERFSVVPARIVASGASVSAAEGVSIPVEQKPLNPFVGLALKTDIKLPDEESLNLMPAVEKKVRPELVAHTSHARTVMLLVVLLLSLGSAGYMVYTTFIKKPASSVRALIPTPAPTASSPTLTPATAEAVLDKSAYTLQVLNGSGIAGEAGKLAGHLSEQEFIVGETGNADRADYSDLIIRHPEAAEEVFLKELDKALKSFYTNRNASYEIATGSADIIIIIGSP